jgi:hypothetical protein
VQRVQLENQAESRFGNLCLHKQGAATVSLVIGDTAHRSGRQFRERVLDHEPDGRRHVVGDKHPIGGSIGDSENCIRTHQSWVVAKGLSISVRDTLRIVARFSKGQACSQLSWFPDRKGAGGAGAVTNRRDVVKAAPARPPCLPLPSIGDNPCIYPKHARCTTPSPGTNPSIWNHWCITRLQHRSLRSNHYPTLLAIRGAWRSSLHPISESRPITRTRTSSFFGDKNRQENPS